MLIFIHLIFVKIYQKLIDWNNNRRKKPLIVWGARQVGKTYLVREFGRAEYESFIEINFHMQGSLKVIFEGDKSADEIYKRMTANIPGIKFIKGKTLIFLDEIQKCSDARTALKFLAEDGRYDVIASGSLLGLAYGKDDDDEVKEVESVPVGYEKQLMMYSLDFEEFLWAYGYDSDTIEYLKELNTKLQEEVKEYLEDNNVEELADIIEVIYAILEYKKVKIEDFENLYLYVII